MSLRQQKNSHVKTNPSGPDNRNPVANGFLAQNSFIIIDDIVITCARNTNNTGSNT